VNLLSESTLGVYAVFFAAFIVGTTFPHNLVYLPSQIYAVGRPMAEKLSSIGRVLWMGSAFSVLGSVTILVAAVATAAYTSTSATIALTVTAAINLVVSSAQDNLRRILHIAGSHWSAASMSIVQFATVAIALVAMIATDIPEVWIPFGSLICANIVSSTLGLVRAGGFGRWKAPAELKARVLVRSGRWLLAQALIPTGAVFLAATVITSLAGAVAMGHAEAARIVAQPVLVFATGLTAVLGPRVMAAAMSRDERGSRAMLRRFTQLTAVVGVLYLGLAGWETPWNPMQLIVPPAYAVNGLVAATIVANIVFGSLFLRIDELMGARREVSLVKVSLVGSPLLVVAALTAGFTGAFARPLGFLVDAGVRYPGYLHYREKVYREG